MCLQKNWTKKKDSWLWTLGVCTIQCTKTTTQSFKQDLGYFKLSTPGAQGPGNPIQHVCEHKGSQAGLKVWSQVGSKLAEVGHICPKLALSWPQVKWTCGSQACKPHIRIEDSPKWSHVGLKVRTQAQTDRQTDKKTYARACTNEYMHTRTCT